MTISQKKTFLQPLKAMEHESVKTAGAQTGEKMDFSIFHIMIKQYLEKNIALDL